MTSARKQFQSVTEASPACLWEWDLQTNEIWRSKRFTEVFGWQTGDVDSSADAWHNRIHPDDKEAVLSRLQQVIDRGGEWAHDYRFQRVDGSYAYVSDQGFTMPITGTPRRITGYLTDVSDRGRPTHELQDTEEGRASTLTGTNEQDMLDEAGRLNSLFSVVQDSTQDVATRNEQQTLLTLVDSSLSFMAIADLAGRLTYINKAGRELIGMEATARVEGINVADFYTPEQYSWLMEVPIPTLLSKGHWSGRLKLKHFKTGEPIPCYANGIRIDDPVTRRPIGRGFMMRDLRPELAAQEAQRKLFTLVDNSVELMSILELDGTNSYINKAGMAMLGFENEQQVQQIPISNLHTPEHFALVEQEVIPSVMNTGRWSGEMLVRHLKTGELFPVFNNTIRIDDPDTGQPIAVGAVMRDMRPERLVQQALLDSEARFRSMIMQAPVAMGLLRGDQLVIESANEFILNLWGKEAHVIGKPLLEALPEIEGQAFPDLLAGVYQSGEPYYGYEVLARIFRNGRLEDGYFNFVYAPVRENSGTVSGILMVATEVTAQVQTRKELEESEKRFRNLMLDAPMATAVYAGPDMVIQLANDAMLSLWGKDASIVGKTLREAVPELDGQPFHQLLANVYTTGTVYQGAEDRTDLIVDGRLQTFYFNLTYKPLRDATGAVYAILNMAVDITYQVKARQQLQQAEESLREAVNLAELAPWTSNVLTGEMTCSSRVNDWLGVAEPITSETHCPLHSPQRPGPCNRYFPGRHDAARNRRPNGYGVHHRQSADAAGTHFTDPGAGDRQRTGRSVSGSGHVAGYYRPAHDRTGPGEAGTTAHGRTDSIEPSA